MRANCVLRQLSNGISVESTASDQHCGTIRACACKACKANAQHVHVYIVRVLPQRTICGMHVALYWTASQEGEDRSSGPHVASCGGRGKRNSCHAATATAVCIAWAQRRMRKGADSCSEAVIGSGVQAAVQGLLHHASKPSARACGRQTSVSVACHSRKLIVPTGRQDRYHCTRHRCTSMPNLAAHSLLHVFHIPIHTTASHCVRSTCAQHTMYTALHMFQ